MPEKLCKLDIEVCQLCGKTLENIVIDGKTVHGPWGYMCPACHNKFGVGLGTGKGQRYVRHPGGWLKTDG